MPLPSHPAAVARGCWLARSARSPSRPRPLRTTVYSEQSHQNTPSNRVRGLGVQSSWKHTQAPSTPCAPGPFPFSTLISAPGPASGLVLSSESLDPFFNLAVEEYILSRSHHTSRVLFLYRNSPCVVIGRNQNPWLEVRAEYLAVPPGQQVPHPPIQLVRRPSGGGAVFHDQGNVNSAVICTSSSFTRCAHTLMVLRSLESLGLHGAKLNDRNDILIPTSASQSHPLKDRIEWRKVSGSAYKITRSRALHHATCLLSSPAVDRISDILNSHGSPYLLGHTSSVTSVKSPIANAGIDPADFIRNLASQFLGMNQKEFHDRHHSGSPECSPPTNIITIDDQLLEIPEISDGYQRLKVRG